MTLRRTHRRTEQIGLRLVHHVAPAVTAALDLYEYKRDAADGMKARAETDGRGTSDNSITEAATIEAEKWTLKAKEITDKVELIEREVGELARLTIGIDRTPAAGEEKRCSDGQVGKDAVLWSTNTECPELPVKLGLCGAHAQAYYRYRVAHHLPVAQYFEDAR